MTTHDTDDTDDETLAQLTEYVRLNPDATVSEVLGEFMLNPAKWADTVKAALAGDLHQQDTAEAPPVGGNDESGENHPQEADSHRSNPGGNVDVSWSTPLAEDVATVDGEHYPAPITDRDWWVAWILDGAGRKRPVAPWNTGHAYPAPWAEGLDAEDRPETSFQEAKKWCDFPFADLSLELPEDAKSDRLRLGIILPTDRPDRENRITVIDWDDVRDPETEEIHPVAAEFIREYGGYVEVSRSGEGLHQYVLGGLRERGKLIAPIDDEPFIRDDRPQVEIYDGGRHVAMTGRHVDGTDARAVEGQELVDDLVREFAEAEKDAGHRRYDPNDNTRHVEGGVDDGQAALVPEPSTGEYLGPALQDLREPSPSTGWRARGSPLLDALEWFHQQLDRDLPNECDQDTPRDYYREERGWGADTIDEKLLGYAPANYRDELVTHLFDLGHDREAILSTGLFGEGLRPLWHGRYVLPYFDAEGRPVYAIARETTPTHPDDFFAGKYAKLAHTRDYADVEEPIYGLDTVREGEPVLITEGIADAITAHEAGYPCLSPVTKQFKKKHHDVLLEALAERDVDRVYLIQDAERPTSDVDDRDRLTLQQFGPGIKGAVRTAAYLADHGLEARVADLPRPGLDKVDLDDYLQGWSNDLTPLLAGAKPVGQHPAYDPDSARDVAIDAAEATDLPRDLDAVDTDGDHSALFDLGIRDVTGLSWDYRGPNPLGHHGESENYFVLLEEHGVAYDHKYKAAYNALTYLLVDAGERRPASPNGRFEDVEVFAAWRHAKRESLIPDDDPIPHRALQYVAREHGLADTEDLVGGWKLPRQAYNAALATVRDEYGVDPGRGDITAGDREHTAVLPPAVRDLSTAASGWDWRHTAAQDGDTLTIEDARARTVDAIADAYERGDQVLVDALPTMGKSYGAVLAVDRTNEPITILTGRGRKEQYAQFKEWANEFDLDIYTLPAFTHDCDTANGEHGEEWKETVMDWYNRGATPQEIHKSAEYVLGEPLPCQRHEGHSCPYASLWNFDPDEYDIVLGHYSHGHKSKVTTGRTVVFDEFPAAYDEPRDVRESAVSYWLSTVDGVPFEDYTDLVENRTDQARRGEALLWFDEHGVEPNEQLVFEDSSAHADAPLLVYALLAGEDLGNGFERATLDDLGTGVRDRRTGTVWILHPPALDYASGVVALDGAPTKQMWELSLDERLNHRQVLADDERAEYIRDALNLNLVRTTEDIKPYNSPEHVALDDDAALLEAVGDEHGKPPSLITTMTAKSEFDDAGVLDLVDEAKHYGNILGSNEFDDTRLGVVIGSNHYGDQFIKKWGGYAGVAVERDAVDDDEPAKGENLTYGSFGDKVHRHMTEHNTLQAAMRFGRDGNGAVVYVHTDTLPEWGPVAGEARVVKTWSDGMRSVVDALETLGSATTGEIAAHPAVDVCPRQVFDHLETLRERGMLNRRQNPDDGRGVVWRDSGVDGLNAYGAVDLGDESDAVDTPKIEDLEVAEPERIDTIYTWEFINSDADTVAAAGDTGRGHVPTGLPTTPEGVPPPEQGE